MKSLITEVINNSDRELVLKEGNGGVYILLAKLQVKGGPGQCKFRIKLKDDATYREYWVASGTEDGVKTETAIHSGECVENETIYIINDRKDATKLTTVPIKRGSSERMELVNRTGNVVELKAQSEDGTQLEGIQIPSNEKIFLEPGSTTRSVELAGGRTIPISNKEVAKNQRVDITTNPGHELDMVKRGLYLTEVTNRSSGQIQVKHLKGKGGYATVPKTLQTGGTHTIHYDPKKKDKYSVEWSSATAGSAPSATTGSAPSPTAASTSSAPLSATTGSAPRPYVLELTSSDFADFLTIDVIDGKTAGMKALQKLEPRPSASKQKDGYISKFLGFFGY